ncbi:MAG: helix-turn-helix domain-containing protein [Pseudomonadota bacterium]|nr:helix-turn-helix domain-containing protein [Pseudomonadota bacterium]
MSHTTTAEELLDEIKEMPVSERGRFFSILGTMLFGDDDLTHEQVFGNLDNDVFTAHEAAEYLEVSIATFRRYVQSGKIEPAHVLGRSQMFATRDLKAFKRSLRDVKGEPARSRA